jgi:hypothetical protein
MADPESCTTAYLHSRFMYPFSHLQSRSASQKISILLLILLAAGCENTIVGDPEIGGRPGFPTIGEYFYDARGRNDPLAINYMKYKSYSSLNLEGSTC